MFDGFSQSVKGVSHEKRGIVCQDSSSHKVTENYAIAVVADGHGGKKYLRSNVGSKLAVESAIEAVETFCKDFKEFDLNFKIDHKNIIKRIEKYAIMLWNEKITAHLNANPVTESEIGKLSYDEFAAIPPESYYGTTLICAVMMKDYSWGFQIGDGSLIAVFDNGETSMLINYDESNPANITYSICNANAFDMFDSFFTYKRPISITVSTDGLYTSFGSDFEFLDYHTIVTGELCNKESCFESLKTNMLKRTHYGTEDDISVSCIYNADLAVSNLEIIKNKINENKRRADERKAKLLNK